MAYIYNPLIPLYLQKKQDAATPGDIEQLQGEIAALTTQVGDKVPKIRTSIVDIDVDEIGQKQNGSTADMTEGFFYKRTNALPIEYEDVTIPSGAKKIIYTNKFDASQRIVYAIEDITLPQNVSVPISQAGWTFLIDNDVHNSIIFTDGTQWITSPTFKANSLTDSGITGLTFTRSQTLSAILVSTYATPYRGSLSEIRDFYNFLNGVYLTQGFRVTTQTESIIGQINDYLIQIVIPIKNGSLESTSTRYIKVGDLAAFDWSLDDYIAQFYPIVETSGSDYYDKTRDVYFMGATYPIFETPDGSQYFIINNSMSGVSTKNFYQTVAEDGESTCYIAKEYLHALYLSEPQDGSNYWAEMVSDKIFFDYTAEIVETSESLTIHRRIINYDEYGFPLIDVPAIERVNAQPPTDPNALDYITASGSGYLSLTASAKSGDPGEQTQAISGTLTVQPLATADNDNKGVAESSDVKSYINTNTATPSQGAKADTALQSISKGTDGDYITTSVTAKSDNTQTVASSLTLQPMLTADDTHKGVAESSDVKKWFTTYIPYNPIYGVMWDTANPSPDCIRIGNLDLHATLPVHSQMIGGTLDDNAVFTPFANQSDWTGETRDGSAGQVMMRFPDKFWYKFITEGTINKVLVSAQEVSGFQVFAPEHYMSAYKATLQRSTLKLSSVVNLDPDYRGGNNTADWDNTYRSLLGKPVSNINLPNFRAYARARWGNNAGNCAVYYLRKMLYWLFVTEYATLNTQKDYNAALDSNGYHQGGLGVGVTDWDGNSWNAYNGYNPLIPCGVTDQYGNQTAQKSYDVIASDGGSIAHSFFVPRYRGIESPFGDIWEWSDGILVNKQAADSGGKSPVYVSNDPSKFSSTDFSQYDYLCDEIRTENFIKAIHFGDNGDFVCVSVPGSSTQYYCDYWYGADLPSNGTSLRGLLFGGSADNGARAGFVCGYSSFAPAAAAPTIGSRLCFLPST